MNEPEVITIHPHWETHVNPLYREGAEGFTHYEIQTVREYCAIDGEPYWETVTDPQTESDTHHLDAFTSPILYGVYGRCSWGGAEHIVDLATLEEARRLLTMMGVIVSA
jgi:hypothetical protein